eukprot:gene13883-16377_t
MSRSILVIVSLVLLASASFEGVSAVKLHRESSLARGLRHRGLEEIEGGPESQWFTQRVNHYDPLDTSTFQQQYFVNDTFYKTGGPVFFLLGGEGPITPSTVTGHFVLNTYAPLFNALIVGIEHRFYGKSVPTPTLDTKFLNLLTTEQALADYAAFVQSFSETYSTGSSKWISFGGSYSGSLSAWMRLKYPNLIDAAIATSAPVQPQLDFPEYFEVVSQSIGPSCSAVVANVTQQVTQMLATNRAAVEKLFSTCDPIVSDLDVATFMESLSGGIAEIVQYDNDNNKYTPFNSTHMCALLEQGDALQSFAAFNNLFNTFSGENCTTSSYNSMVAQVRDVTNNGPNAASRLWTWQTCTEYGYFQTGESPNQPFSNTITLEWYVQQCTDIFGPPGSVYNPNTNWILSDYGGRDLQSSETIMVNGGIDPWHALSLLTTSSPAITTAWIPTGAHCSELYPPLPTDSTPLILARKMEVELIQSIVNN